jgi:hypothetical protein
MIDRNSRASDMPLNSRASDMPLDEEWALYAAHRARFTEALVESGRGRSGRLCVLGAGPCNDIDLERLASAFSEIHLVDIAPKPMARAVARQPAEIRPRIFRHAPVDLSGLSARRLAKWKRFAPTAPEVATAAASSLQSIVAALRGPFDVVASACVLTQMAFDLRASLGEGHPMLGTIRLALMASHVNLLIQLMSARGACLFVSDAASSTNYPLGDLSAGGDLRGVLSDVVKRGACYFAANPNVIASFLGRVGEPELLDPWLWTGALERTYLVYAFRLWGPDV